MLQVWLEKKCLKTSHIDLTWQKLTAQQAKAGAGNCTADACSSRCHEHVWSKQYHRAQAAHLRAGILRAQHI